MYLFKVSLIVNRSDPSLGGHFREVRNEAHLDRWRRREACPQGAINSSKLGLASPPNSVPSHPTTTAILLCYGWEMGLSCRGLVVLLSLSHLSIEYSPLSQRSSRDYKSLSRAASPLSPRPRRQALWRLGLSLGVECGGCPPPFFCKAMRATKKPDAPSVFTVAWRQSALLSHCSLNSHFLAMAKVRRWHLR